jgi:hypothetical protein
MLALQQSGHVNLYTAVAENLSRLWILGDKLSWIVLLLRYAIFIFACLTILMIYVVSLPM